MPRKLENFPPQFLKVTQHCVGMIITGRGEEILFRAPCASVGQAANLMMQMRQYWKAIQNEYVAGKLPEYAKEHELAPHLSMIACRALREDPRVVEFLHRGQLSTAKVLGEALSGLDAAIAAAVVVAPPAAKTPPLETVLGEIYGGKAAKK